MLRLTSLLKQEPYPGLWGVGWGGDLHQLLHPAARLAVAQPPAPLTRVLSFCCRTPLSL